MSSNPLPRILDRATRRFVDDTYELIELLHQFLESGKLPVEFAFRDDDGSEREPLAADVAVMVARCEMT